MFPNPQFPADMVTCTEEIFNEKQQILYNGSLHRASLLWLF